MCGPTGYLAGGKRRIYYTGCSADVDRLSSVTTLRLGLWECRNCVIRQRRAQYSADVDPTGRKRYSAQSAQPAPTALLRGSNRVDAPSLSSKDIQANT